MYSKRVCQHVRDTHIFSLCNRSKPKIDFSSEKMYGLFFVFLFSFCVGALFKVYFKLRVRQNECYNCLVGKTAIVTGANTGIGYVTALDFAKRGCRVILACRNPDRAEDAVQRIKRETGNPNVLYKILDLAWLQSVREFARDFNTHEERLDILVNNAGGIGFENRTTDDGLQLILQINHVGPFLLTHLLLDKLKSAGAARIVNVASIAAWLAGRMDLDRLNLDPKLTSGAYAATKMYEKTKLCNVLFTVELARRLAGSGVTANTLHPGAVSTDLMLRFPILANVACFVAKLFFKTPVEGAQTTIYVALSNTLDNVSGKLFDNCRQIDMYSNARNPKFAQKLWMLTEEWAKLKENEKMHCT